MPSSRPSSGASVNSATPSCPPVHDTTNEDYLNSQDCVTLFEQLLQKRAQQPNAQDPVGDIAAFLHNVHRVRLGLAARKGVEGLRAIANKRVVLCADLNPECGPATLSLRLDALRATIHSLVLLNTKVLLYADFGPLQPPPPVEPGFLNSMEAEQSANQQPSSPPGTTAGSSNSPGQQQHILSSGTPSAGGLAPPSVGHPPLSPPNTGGSPSARNSVSLPVQEPKSPVLAAFKELMQKERVTVRFVRNLNSELPRREYVYLTNSELLVLPMMCDSEGYVSSLHPSCRRSSEDGATTLLASGGGSPSNRPPSPTIQSISSHGIVYTLSSFGEVFVLDSLASGRFHGPAFSPIPRAIPEQYFGFTANAEIGPLVSLLCGASQKGKKRALLLGDGPLKGPPLPSIDYGYGTPVSKPPIAPPHSSGANAATPWTALSWLAQNPTVLQNIIHLFDVVFIAGRSARRFYLCEKEEKTKKGAQLSTSEDLDIQGSLALQAALKGSPVEIVLAKDFSTAKAINKKRTNVPNGNPLPSPKHKWFDIGPETTTLLSEKIKSEVGTMLWIGSIGEVAEGTGTVLAATEIAETQVVLCGESALRLVGDGPQQQQQQLAASKMGGGATTGALMSKLSISSTLHRTLMPIEALTTLLSSKPLPGLEALPVPSEQ